MLPEVSIRLIERFRLVLDSSTQRKFPSIEILIDKFWSIVLLDLRACQYFFSKNEFNNIEVAESKINCDLPPGK